MSWRNGTVPIRIRPMAVFIAAAFVVLPISSPAALAQTTTTLDGAEQAPSDGDDQAEGDEEGAGGAADHRTAPVLAPGRHTDAIVTGDTRWYAVLYTNDVPYRFEADLVTTDLDTQTELDLVVSLIGPTLGSVGSGRLLEGSASYSGGGINKWFLAVTLKTEGRLGLQHQLVLDIEGVQAGLLDECGEDCTLDEDLEALEEEVASLQADLEERNSAEFEDAVRSQIADLEGRRSKARATVADAEGEISTLCTPDPDCDQLPDQEAVTPAWALIAGAVVLVLGLGALIYALIRRRGRP